MRDVHESCAEGGVCIRELLHGGWLVYAKLGPWIPLRGMFVNLHIAEEYAEPHTLTETFHRWVFHGSVFGFFHSPRFWKELVYSTL